MTLIGNKGLALLVVIGLAVFSNGQTHSNASKAPSKKTQAVTEETHYYAAVDLGSKGTKASLYSFVTEEEGRNPDVLFSKTINTKLVTSMKDGQFTKEGIADAADAVKQEVDAMKVEATKRKIEVELYYVVGSSGVAKATNRAALVEAVKAGTGIDMDFVDVAREGYYGLLSSVPLSRRTASMYIDIGSGNTKLGCLVGNSDLKSFKSTEIPFGASSAVNEATKRNPKDINAGIEAVVVDVNQAYEQQSREIPCLRNRPRIYWTGGTAWATATFMHPEKELSGWVTISKHDLDTFAARLKNGSWNQKKTVFDFPKDMPPARQEAIRKKAEEERYGALGVENVFVREQLLAGVSIMQAVLKSSNPSATLRFVRSGNFIYGYALEKFQEDVTRQ